MGRYPRQTEPRRIAASYQLLVIVSTSAADVLVRNLVSPIYFAVIEFEPTESDDDVLYVAMLTKLGFNLEISLSLLPLVPRGDNYFAFLMYV
jgi:hypothetical protein